MTMMSLTDAVSKADRLLERAVELNALRYGDFTLSSGQSSKFYFDGRLLSMDPESAYIISDLFVNVLMQRDIHVFGGPAVGAVPMVGTLALKAYQENLKFKGFFVRSEQKKHGMGKLIEGDVSAGDTVAIYDDTISTGGSLLEAIDAVEKLPADIQLALCVLDRKQGGPAELTRRGIPLFNILVKTERDTVEVDRDTLREWFS